MNLKNVTSGLDRHVEWGQRGEQEDERNTKRCEGEGEEVPEHRAELHIRTGQQARGIGSAWRGRGGEE